MSLEVSSSVFETTWKPHGKASLAEWFFFLLIFLFPFLAASAASVQWYLRLTNAFSANYHLFCINTRNNPIQRAKHQMSAIQSKIYSNVHFCLAQWDSTIIFRSTAKIEIDKTLCAKQLRNENSISYDASRAFVFDDLLEEDLYGNFYYWSG